MTFTTGAAPDNVGVAQISEQRHLPQRVRRHAVHLVVGEQLHDLHKHSCLGLILPLWLSELQL